MPTAEEAAALVYKKVYSWKSGQLAADSTYTAYMYPAAGLVNNKTATAVWNAQAGTAYKYMTEAILGLNDQLSISMATAGDSYEVTGSSVDDYVFNLAASDFGLIDNKTKHESTVYYNFGKISSNETIYNEEGEDYVVPVQTYKTVFACPLHEDVQTYAWAEAATGYTYDNATGKYTLTYSKLNEITYGQEDWDGTVKVYAYDQTNGADDKSLLPTNDQQNRLNFLNATNKFNNTLFSGNLTTLLDSKYTEVVKATLTSADTNTEDYFTVKVNNKVLVFTPKKRDANSNPSKDIASNLNITVKDAFGHQHVISVPFTVKRQ